MARSTTTVFEDKGFNNWYFSYDLEPIDLSESIINGEKLKTDVEIKEVPNGEAPYHSEKEKSKKEAKDDGFGDDIAQPQRLNQAWSQRRSLR